MCLVTASTVTDLTKSQVVNDRQQKLGHCLVLLRSGAVIDL